jgi:hypothetical protein
MIAELVAFNAAFGVVKQFIGNGKDLHDCFGQIGQMVNAKEDLKARQQKNKKSLFASDAEEFMALEQIAKAEEELKDFMVYFGRAGLWDDFIVFQAKASKARLEAKNAHIQKINQRSALRRSCSWMCLGLCRAIRLFHDNICNCKIGLIHKLGVGMSEQQEQQPVILTIDDQEYDVNELGNDTKVHYVQVVNLRKQLADLQNQIAAAQQQSINLQVALGFRENALRESIQVVEEPEAEAVN